MPSDEFDPEAATTWWIDPVDRRVMATLWYPCEAAPDGSLWSEIPTTVLARWLGRTRLVLTWLTGDQKVRVDRQYSDHARQIEVSAPAPRDGVAWYLTDDGKRWQALAARVPGKPTTPTRPA